MTIRLAFLVDSPSKRAHGNAASRLALGLVETGRVETTLLCYSDDPRATVASAGGAAFIASVPIGCHGRCPASSVTFGASKPDVLITRQVHANFVGLAAAWTARVPRRLAGKADSRSGPPCRALARQQLAR